MLSPGVTSPLVPLSKSVCVAEPPTEERLPCTASPVLAGFMPGVTVTLRRDVPPGSVEVAVPRPVGGVGPPGGWMVEYRMVSPSAPAWLPTTFQLVGLKGAKKRVTATQYVPATSEPSWPLKSRVLPTP